MYSTLRVPGENKVIMTVEPKKKSWYDMCIEDEEKEEQEQQEQQEKQEEQQEKQEQQKKQEEQQKQKDISETRKALFTQGKYELEEGDILE